MDITRLTVEVRDKDLKRIGQVPSDDLSMLIEDQFRNVGSWSLKLPSESALAGVLRQPGAGIIVTLENGDVLMSGPTVQPEDSATSTDPDGTLTINGLTDNVLLADRLCFPNPANLDPANQPETHDVRTGTCEDLMYAYLSANIGPDAPVSADPDLGSRRDIRLTLGSNGHRGPTVTRRARFNVLGDLLRELAAAAGIGFRVVQVGDKLEFQTFDVADRAGSIRLDIRNSTLAGHTVATAPPSITRAIVAGQDVERNADATDDEWRSERQFVAVSTAASRAGEAEWGRRVEVFVDRRQQDGNDELIQAGEEALQEGGASQLSVQVVPMEDFYSTFGVDWNLGDRITVVVRDVEMQADITGYVLRYDANGFRMGVILGNPAALSRSPATQVQSLDARVSALERNSVTPAALSVVEQRVVSRMALVVKDQPVGTVIPGVNQLVVNLPDGKAMVDTDYVIHFFVTERNDGAFGSAVYSALEARPISTTSFRVRFSSSWTSNLSGFISYTLTPVPG
ncbi:siphovirus ReqiPepy6 Gp37-like family protein [Micromonospora sp. NBC_01813]|uniref:siphovirus ReqiPepy6 Gp37-like family protein n=1 Tax=Micromonospora sp. NBC_01813 TaxID=2975988 RepID=UPI002DD8ED49|nr:siphovirus ReqiPepy6 Gp37-like family protein [Micromonospora sp. NBC_01813]WSA11558.1 siphovirus ReqiPepy6 Gp37-like family protein [Micromonospora sp. NBC_01813]